MPRFKGSSFHFLLKRKTALGIGAGYDALRLQTVKVAVFIYGDTLVDPPDF